jgi:hypothetical protein
MKGNCALPASRRSMTAIGRARTEGVGVNHWRLTVYQRTCRGLPPLAAGKLLGGQEGSIVFVGRGAGAIQSCGPPPGPGLLARTNKINNLSRVLD